MRKIQFHMEYKNIKTVEIYTHVTFTDVDEDKNPLEDLKSYHELFGVVWHADVSFIDEV